MLERTDNTNLEKYYEQEIEDDKIFIEPGQTLYSSIFHDCIENRLTMAFLDESVPQILFDSAEQQVL